MMNKKLIAALLAAAIMVSALCGCTLAREDGTAENARDRLIGVYMTTEYLDLFDWAAYLEENADKLFPGGKVEAADGYSQRLYATRSTVSHNGYETDEFDFEGIEGIAFFSPFVRFGEGELDTYVTFISGDEVSFSRMTAGDETSIEGTVYMGATAGICFYMNPVYETAGGEVYLMSGTGMYMDTPGSGSQTVNETYTETVNGESIEREFTATVHFESRADTQKVVVKQMDENDALLSLTEITAGDIPDSIEVLDGTAYLLVEDHAINADGASVITRSLLERDEQTVFCFFTNEKGFAPASCVQLT